MQKSPEQDSPRLTTLLSPAVRDCLSCYEEKRQYQRGQTIYAEGDEAHTMMLVHTGSVRVSRMTVDGRQLIAGVFGPGHCVGLVGLLTGKRDQDVIAVDAVTVGFVSREAFDIALKSRPEFAAELLPVVINRLRAAVTFIDDLKNGSTVVLTAGVIEQLLEASDNPNVIAWNQSDIAHVAGSSRVSVGKALKELEQRQLIKLGYGQIEVPDVHRLTEWLREQRR